MAVGLVLVNRHRGEASSPAGFATGLGVTSVWMCPGLREDFLLMDLPVLTIGPAHV